MNFPIMTWAEAKSRKSELNGVRKSYEAPSVTHLSLASESAAAISGGPSDRR